MKHIIIALVLFIVSLSTAQQVNTNHIFVIDKSGSMIGIGQNNENIWNDVIGAIKVFIGGVGKNSRITIYSYSTITSDATYFNIYEESDKDKVYTFLDGINPEGHTCTYRALSKVVKEFNQSRKKYADVIYLYTDGHNNCGTKTMHDISREFNAKKDDFDFLYYISLGKAIPEDVEKAAEANDNIKTVYVEKPSDQVDIVVPGTVFIKSGNIVFDLIKVKNQSQFVPISFRGDINAHTIDLRCELLDKSLEGIELNPYFPVNELKGKLTITLQKGYHFSENIETMVKVYSNDKSILFKNNVFRITILLPKRGIKIKVE